MRSLALPVACTAGIASLAVLFAFACSKDAEPTVTAVPMNEGGMPMGDGGAGVDAAKREAGTPTKCATVTASTTSDACSCGEQSAPATGPPTDKCPINDTPHYCVSYDVTNPPPLRRECACQPKCLFQQVVGGSGDGGGTTDTCRCGVSSHLVLGGDGSKDVSRATCEGFAVCCRHDSGCDCTSDAAYTCPANSMKVASCTPDDFNTSVWRAVVYGNPAYTDLVDVARCR